METAGRLLKVLSVSPSVVGGGAERVALELHKRLPARGVESHLAVANRNAELPGVLQIPCDAQRNPLARLVLPAAWHHQSRSVRSHDAQAVSSRAIRVAAEPGRWLRVARGHEDFDFPWTRDLLDISPSGLDVLHLHNLHGGYFDIRALPALSSTVPTIVTMHDAWLLTGHCAQPLECDRWRHGCGGCPDLERYVPIRRDASAWNRDVKRRALTSSKISLATPSRWLMTMLEDSGLLENGTEVRVIPNGVDVSVFSPGDRAAARDRLGLPQHRQIVLAAARGARDNPFKGFDTLLEAMCTLDAAVAERLVLVTLGDDSGASSVGGVEVRSIPFAEDASVVADYYRAADLYVLPSLAESFGLSAVESMACGTAVLASDAGALPEVVIDGECGALFATGSASHLAAQLELLLGDVTLLARYARAGLARVHERFTIERQVDSYVSWYAELTGVQPIDAVEVSIT